MALRTILRYPDPRLYRKAASVSVFNAEFRRLVSDMAETMYAAPGIGLAAPQIDVLQRVMVIDVSEDRSRLRAFANPVIVEREGVQLLEEGCLSVPGIFEPVERAERIRVRAQDPDGKPFEVDAEGLLAVCIQHETDHLDGKVFVDYLSRLKRQRIKTKLLKQIKKSA
ncbi:MAG: peptide deformylase [Burkholderiales bacterium]|nr:peptide deformylase [Burkholderiales bacterium]